MLAQSRFLIIPHRAPKRTAKLPQLHHFLPHALRLQDHDINRVLAKWDADRDLLPAREQLPHAARDVVGGAEALEQLGVPEQAEHAARGHAGAVVGRVARGHGLEAAPEVLGRGAAGLEDREVDVPPRVQLLGHALREPLHRELGRVVVRAARRRHEAPHRAHE